MTTLNAETITARDIRALRAEAEAAGDYRQIDWCDVCLAGREETNDDGMPLVDPDGNPTTRTAAREICAAAINNARAQADG